MCPPGYLRFAYDISGYMQKDDKKLATRGWKKKKVWRKTMTGGGQYEK